MKVDGTSDSALKRMYVEKSKAERVAVGGRHEPCRGARRSHLHLSSPVVHSTDSEGVDRMHKKQSDVFHAPRYFNAEQDK